MARATACFLQRMKDKLGNKSNASTEMEFQDTWGVMVGRRRARYPHDHRDGDGQPALLRHVFGRNHASGAGAGPASHISHRSAFQKRLIQQPLMQNVLADMAVEVEAALALGLRIARAMDNADNPSEAALARIGTAVAKYWNTKRCPSLVVEALECHGGPGYVEESIMPRLYREAPLNSIWEGSGNVMGLDVLRAIGREPEAIPACHGRTGTRARQSPES